MSDPLLKRGNRELAFVAFFAVASIGIMFAALLSGIERKVDILIAMQERAAIVQKPAVLDEQAALKWWAGADDLHGARERLCKNYYPRKEK